MTPHLLSATIFFTFLSFIMNKTLIGILVAVVLVGGWTWSGYNGLVQAEENVSGSWAQVETQYQRRFDLVPNLVSTVKGAANFEQETFTAVTAARTQWQQAGSASAKIEAAGGFESALSRLLVTVEAYPQLQATQAYRDLMTQLEGTENRIATARRDYNQEVRVFNKLIKVFPRNVLASLFGFGEEAYFDAVAEADTAPTVDF